MHIETVKITETGLLINGKVNVPNNPKDRHYRKIQKWIEQGNSISPKFTKTELLEKAVEEKKKEIDLQRDELIQRPILFRQDGRDHYLSRNIRSELSWMRKKNAVSPWITDDNEIISITLKEFDSINSHLSDRDDPAFTQARKRKDAVLAIQPSDTKTIDEAIQEVKNYDITQVYID